MGKPMVTVYCLAYNHEKYIRKCLYSILGQKTNFPFKIIVNDDASTDNTRSIIEEIAAKYPDVIIPVLHDENQFQKKVSVVKTHIEPRVESKYVAICEGDDYWCNSNKLQMQFDIMEANPKCGACLHRTAEVTEDEKKTGLYYPMQDLPTGVLSSKEFFDAFEPRMFHTTSYFFRASLWHAYLQDPPAYKAVCHVGDVPYLLYFGSKSRIYFINKVMSCYRRGGVSSFTYSRFQVNPERLIRHHLAIIRTYQEFDKETDGKYHWLCIRRISKNMYAESALRKDFSEMTAEENRDYYKGLPLAKRCTVLVGSVCPSLINKIYIDHLTKTEKKERKRWNVD